MKPECKKWTECGWRGGPWKGDAGGVKGGGPVGGRMGERCGSGGALRSRLAARVC